MDSAVSKEEVIALQKTMVAVAAAIKDLKRTVEALGEKESQKKMMKLKRLLKLRES